MGEALPSAGLGVASIRERHGESLLWTGQSTGQVLEAPRAVVKRLGQFIGALDREPVVGNLRDSNDHCRQAPPNTPRTMNFSATEPVYRAGSAKSRHLAVFWLPAPSHRGAVWYPLVLGRPAPCRTC